MKNINNLLPINKAVKLIKKSNGKIFTVTFRKKDGKFRKMNCRLGVKKYITGIGMSYDPLKLKLLPVFDLKKNNYRMINLSTISHLKIDSKQYKITHQ